MKVIFERCKLLTVKEVLTKKSIDYSEWQSDNDKEIRVSIEELNESEAEYIQEQFGIEDDLYDYSYLIFWY